MESKTLADAFVSALHELEQAGDGASVQALVALFADDTRLVNTALLLGATPLSGTEGATEFWTQYKKTIGVGKSEFHHIVASENMAGLFWKTTVRGGAAQYDGATLLEFDGSGKIRYFQGYYDTRQLNEAVGVGD